VPGVNTTRSSSGFDMKMITCLISLLFLLFSPANAGEDITITVVYNNVPCNENLATKWGLSILIQGLTDTILFDTGGDGTILLSNMKILGIKPDNIETVVLSHIHTDHVGGLAALLEENSTVSVYIPASFPDEIINSIQNAADSIILIDKPQEICMHVWSTGELGESMKEQSLIIITDKGLVIVTGCAHPGIVNIVRFAKDYLNKNVYLVMGGFHLLAYDDNQVNEIIDELKALGVKKVGPSHCTGGRPIELFKETWDGDFIDLGCGAKVHIPLNNE
jgi:7,8-dihydropterin-6-yl-methyl-4-(beta-D-ribofuranosyl)aminobenzene 5'-phosphate synthase